MGETELAKALTAAGAVVRVVRLPPTADPTKQGLDDYLMRHGADALRQLLTDPPPPPAGKGDGDADEGGRKPSAADQLAAVAAAESDLWHDDTGTGYATVGRRSMAVRGKAFRLWLISRYRAASEGKVPNADALGSAVNAIEADAVYDGPEYEAHVRVAAHVGKVYLHLADDADTVIEVDANGWRECANPSERFLAAYTANQRGAHEQALDGSSLAGAVVALMNGQDEWTGTATELYKALNPHALDPVPKDWPKAANALSGRLRRLAPDLRRVHRIDFATDRATDATRRRIIRLRRVPSVEGEGPSAPSRPSTAPGTHAARPDGPPDDTRSHRPAPSAGGHSAAWGSDGLDDADDLLPGVQPLTADEFAAFLNMH